MRSTAGAQIRQLREERGWSQERLAEKSGVSARQVHRIEAGSSPQPRTLRKLAKALGTDVTRLLCGYERERVDAIMANNTCGHCRADLVERVYGPHEYGDCEQETFACGSSRGWQERPCPHDPRFPKFEDYELVFLEEEGTGMWTCFASAKTETARAVSLRHGYSASLDKAAKFVERSYVEARDGHEEAERRFPWDGVV